MKQVIKRARITLDINIAVAKEMNISLERINAAQNRIKSMNPFTKRFIPPVPPQLLVIKGESNQRTYIKNESAGSQRKAGYVIVHQMPLSFTVTQQRGWIERTNKFFKKK